MMDVQKILLASVVGYLIGISAAYAGAWTQERGHMQIIITNSYYVAGSYFDNNGHRQSQSSYHKFDFNPYVEYGLLDGVTIGANLSLPYLWQNSTTGTQYSAGVGDSEFFTRLRLWQKNGVVIAAEPIIKLPAPASSLQPRLGSSTPDAGMGIAAGYGFDANGLHHFADVNIGYRYRFGMPHDQWRITGTLGYSLRPQWMLMPQVFITERAGVSPNAVFTQSAADDYDLVKLQLSVVYKFNNATSIQWGAFGNIAGKNTGTGNGTLISVWRNF